MYRGQKFNLFKQQGMLAKEELKRIYPSLLDKVLETMASNHILTIIWLGMMAFALVALGITIGMHR